MRIFPHMKEHSQDLGTRLLSLQDLKCLIRCLPKKLTNKLKLFIKNLKNSEKKKEESGETLVSAQRRCCKCNIDKPLNIENYQVIKTFKQGYSFYCNDCSKPKLKH